MTAKPMQNPVLGWMQVPAVLYWHLLPHVFSTAATVGIGVGIGVGAGVGDVVVVVVATPPVSAQSSMPA
jgi:hypothetical protein